MGAIQRVFNHVLPVAQVQHKGVAPSATTQHIVAAAAGQHVVACTGAQHIVAFIAIQAIAHIGASQSIAAAVALHHKCPAHQGGVIHHGAVGKLKTFHRARPQHVLRLKTC